MGRGARTRGRGIVCRAGNGLGGRLVRAWAYKWEGLQLIRATTLFTAYCGEAGHNPVIVPPRRRCTTRAANLKSSNQGSGVGYEGYFTRH